MPTMDTHQAYIAGILHARRGDRDAFVAMLAEQSTSDEYQLAWEWCEALAHLLPATDEQLEGHVLEVDDDHGEAVD